MVEKVSGNAYCFLGSPYQHEHHLWLPLSSVYSPLAGESLLIKLLPNFVTIYRWVRNPHTKPQTSPATERISLSFRSLLLQSSITPLCSHHASCLSGHSSALLKSGDKKALRCIWLLVLPADLSAFPSSSIRYWYLLLVTVSSLLDYGTLTAPNLH